MLGLRDRDIEAVKFEYAVSISPNPSRLKAMFSSTAISLAPVVYERRALNKYSASAYLRSVVSSGYFTDIIKKKR